MIVLPVEHIAAELAKHYVYGHQEYCWNGDILHTFSVVRHVELRLSHPFNRAGPGLAWS